MNQRYRRLFETLRRKHYRIPCVYVVHGSIRVPYEAGDDWTVGAFLVRAEAENMVAQLENNLETLKDLTADAYTAFRIAQAAHDRHERAEAEKRSWEDFRNETQEEFRSRMDREREHPLYVAEWDARDKFEEEIYKHSQYLDPGIPWPRSQIFSEYDREQIRYSIQEIELRG